MPENSSKVPLVRCPKCGRLLPELPPYSVYCCGGCGGFLRAEKKLNSDDNLSENLSEGRPSEGSKGVDNDGGIGVEYDSERSPVKVRFRFGDSATKSPLRETNPDGLDDHTNSPLRDLGVESKSSGRSGDGDDRKSPSIERGGGNGKSLTFSVRGGVGKSVVIGRDDRRSGMRENFVADFEEIEARDRVESIEESSTDWLQCEPMADRTGGSSSSVSPRRRRASHTEDPPMGFGPEMRAERVGRRADGSGKEYGNMYVRSHVEVPYDDWVDEGDDGVARGNRGLRVQDGYVGVFVKPRKRMEQWGDERIRFNSVHEDDEVLATHRRVPVSSYEGSSNYRAELLCKYNKLHEQLIRIGDQISYNRQGDQGIASTDIYGGPDDYVYDEYSRVRRGTVRSDGLNESTRMRPHYIGVSPAPSEFPFHDNPSSSQIPGRTIHHQPPYYHEQFATWRSMDSTYDPRRENLHRPACPCSNCYAGNLQAHIRTPAAAFGHKRSPNSHIGPASDYPDAYRKSALDLTLPKPTHHNPSPHQRSSVDSKSDEGHGKRVLVVNQNWKLCHPIAGGAPFVICFNCFQLLRLPGKLIAAKKKQFNLQCRSCRAILSLDFNMKRSGASDQTPSKPISADACDVPCEVVTESHHNIRKSESYEYNGNGYPFPYTDSEPSTELEDRRLISAEAAKRSSFTVPSSQASKDAYSSEAAVCQNDPSAKAEKPSTSVLHPLPPPPSSPQRDHMDYIFSTKRSEEESGTLNQDKGTAQRESSFMTYVGNTVVPNELEFNYGEIPKTDASQGSADAPTGKCQGGVSEASEPSFATLRLNTSVKIDEVFVNGKPITSCSVRTAEKMAGPISPGEYWYDSKAGFWGFMGGCCLGIIPPCIEEFSSQMPANCSGGKTCIYVNGRELHEFDLDMLSSRGFHRTRYRYYLVDASGKVKDERTGAFVHNLGKLAPTVESTGCGFGMRPPGTHND